MKQVRKRLTYANVVSSLALFLVVAGGSAFAANQLAKNSVGNKQLKKNAVTAAKIKKNAVTTAKIKANAVTGAKIQAGAISGDKIDLATVGTVPNSAATDSIRSTAGTLKLGEERVIFTYGPVSITNKCLPYGPSSIGSKSVISSTVENTVFTSWEDNSSKLGPNTPEDDRDLSNLWWQSSEGAFDGEPPFDTGASVLAPTGEAFNAWIGEATEKDTGTCWYWLTANIIK